MPLTLQAINRFPVKSCRGEALTSATVEPWGLAGDRRWMVVDADGTVVTAREYPQLVLVRPQLNDDGSLDLHHPDQPSLHVDVPVGGLVPVQVWASKLDAADAGPQAGRWFAGIVDKPAHLVYLDDPTRRAVNPDHARPGDVVSFADGYPLLLVTSASMDALNDLIAAGRRAEEGPLPVMRFRPNVVVDGSAAWAEDGWRRVRIGQASFRAAKGCARCVLTLIDPDDASRGREPLATLVKHRRWDGQTWFGMNLIPDTPGTSITVGDDVEVLEAVDAPDGPPR